MSYASLVLDGDDAQAAHEFGVRVVPLVVDGRATERKDRRSAHQRLAVGGLFLEGLVAGLLGQLGDAIHGPIERPIFPVVRIRRAILDRRPAAFVDRELVAGGALWTQIALADGRVRVALDVDDLAVDR